MKGIILILFMLAAGTSMRTEESSGNVLVTHSFGEGGFMLVQYVDHVVQWVLCSETGSDKERTSRNVREESVNGAPAVRTMTTEVDIPGVAKFVVTEKEVGKLIYIKADGTVTITPRIFPFETTKTEFNVVPVESK